jgi:hypothetical protein
MKRLLLIVVAMASACETMAQSGATPSVRSQSVRSRSQTSPEGVTDAVAEEALRRAVWHSTEMLAARAYVLAYCERSKRMSRTDGERYLRRVSQLSSEEMLEWLGRVQQQRAALERRRLAEEEARALSVGLAEERLRKMDEAGYNVGQTKAWMTETWRQQAELAAEPATSARLPISERAAALAAQRLVFDPFAPTLDPASPGAYERYAAAASLPGDLPRGDPANFLRGDDRGGATTGIDGSVGGVGAEGGAGLSGTVSAGAAGLEGGTAGSGE